MAWLVIIGIDIIKARDKCIANYITTLERLGQEDLWNFIEKYFEEMLDAKGAVRATLKKYLK